MNNAVLMYNFGNSRIVELLVSLYSLRKIYDGSVCLYLPYNDPHNDYIIGSISNLEVGIEYFDIDSLSKRNLKSVIKPSLMLNSSFDNSLMCDSDLLFLRDFSSIFKDIDEYGVVMTQFYNWNCNGKIMKKRINKLTFLSDEELFNATSESPAVNIGVMGVNSHNGNMFLNQWSDYTIKAGGIFISDELTANAIKSYHRHKIVDHSFNTSFKYNKNIDLSTQSKILHYHGSKSHKHDNEAGGMWWAVYNMMKDDGYDMDYWVQFNKRINEEKKDIDINETIIKVKKIWSC